MPDEKQTYEHLPIPPSYEEATSSSRPSSSQSHSRLGPAETSDDAERQGLLGRGGYETEQGVAAGAPRNGSDQRPALFSRWGTGGYQQPTVQSVADSDEDPLADMLDDSGEEGDDGGDEDLRRDMEQMEVLDPGGANSSRLAERGARVRSTLSKRLSSLTTTLSAIPMPSFGRLRPSMRFLTSRLPDWPEHYRPGFAIFARLFGLFLVISLLYALFVTQIIPSGQNGYGQQFDPEWAREFAQGSVNVERIRENLQQISRFDHVAGTEGDYALAKDIEHMFTEMGFEEVRMSEYQVYLNYPTKDGRKVAITSPPELAWEAKLEEEQVIPSQVQTFAFHGHSHSGNVKGPLIYANYGSRDDFKTLKDAGIDVKGAVVLVRYYGTQADRAMKVKAAEEAGAVGCLIYSDPEQDGSAQGEVAPDGRWRPSDSVQRGSVSLMNRIIGDVLTPGWASTPEAHRVGVENNPGLNSIPSFPLAWRDAQNLLKALKGHGKKMKKGWIGKVPDVNEWWTGNHKSPEVNLKNEQDEVKKSKIWNVLAEIQGFEQNEKKIIVGNHRDSWCFGAADPGSGTAVMLEVARILGMLRSQGWQPRRTIVFASWDAEEYNLIGSTEYVEEQLVDLRLNGLAYLNVDVGVTGGQFHAAGSPVFKHPLLRVLNRVGDFNLNKTLREVWTDNDDQLGVLGAGSDYVAFQDMAGTSSLDFGFKHKTEIDTGVAAYPYHSCYETFEWMDKHIDPGFYYHGLLAQIWVLLVLDLAQSPILPFDFHAFADALPHYIDNLEKAARQYPSPSSSSPSSNKDKRARRRALDLSSLRTAAKRLTKRVATFDLWGQRWYSVVYNGGRMESASLRLQRLGRNAAMAEFETALLKMSEGEYQKPLPKTAADVVPRAQFKHFLYAPHPGDGYANDYLFPFVRDAMGNGDFEGAQGAVLEAANAIEAAGLLLEAP